ncbi:MAG: [protein-PII] uridylyltransferase [Alphaproteobacteria bacterium]|jgi:[protein-PII] uridylyltransferase|nr:[protein-PII] uridylyltransferase [Alphaproteobacteria bacterium]
MLKFLKSPGETVHSAEPAGLETESPQAQLQAQLAARLAGLEPGPDGKGVEAMRDALRAVLQARLEEGRVAIKARFLDSNDGMGCIHALSALIDEIVAALADIAASRIFPPAGKPGSGERMAVVAVGGYGRGELAPESDIDLLFLMPGKSAPRLEQIVQFILYTLWDLRLKVGQAVRSVDECIKSARQDQTISTNLLEARLLCGDKVLFEDLRRRYQKDIVKGNHYAFVESKLAERDERHRKLGDSRYVLEPNVKEGKGGLRDLQTLLWLAKFLYGVDDLNGLVGVGVLTKPEARRFGKVESQLWTLRCHLHYLAGRPEERLTFDVQTLIAERLGYGDRPGRPSVERFMKHYFLIAKEVGDLTRIFCAALEAESKRKPRRALWFLERGVRSIDGFKLEGERLDVNTQDQFETNPADMVRLFRVSQEHNLDIHPHALTLITRSLGKVRGLAQDDEANRLFLEILTAKQDPEPALRRMSEAGVLGRLIHDFGRVVAQMQYDMYHVYTTDEHTLHALGILHRIEIGALSSELAMATRVMRRIVSRRALYVAVFLHDIAKGRGGDHSELGARVARRLGPRLGLDDEETETVEWLVRQHLLMSRVAFKRDIEDEKTIRDFVDVVESPERLRLLLVLTTTDISAVGPGRFNNWRATLLANLFNRSLHVMSGGLDAEGREIRVRAAQDALREMLTDWPAEELDAFIAKGYTPYWLSLDTDTHAYHARLVREIEASGDPLRVDTRVDPVNAVTEVTILTEDHPGLFARLAGALALCGANIVEAKIFTLTDGMALDIFTVQDAATGTALESGDKLAKLSVMVERCLSGEVWPARELAKRRSLHPSRTRVMKVQPRVLIENEVSRTHTVIEVNARDRPGLLHDVTRMLTAVGCQISSAKIATYGLRAVDVFYVKDIFGLKITHEGKLREIHHRLNAVLLDPDCSPSGGPGPGSGPQTAGRTFHPTLSGGK